MNDMDDKDIWIKITIYLLTVIFALVVLYALYLTIKIEIYEGIQPL